jgi:hypothetical protein
MIDSNSGERARAERRDAGRPVTIGRVTMDSAAPPPSLFRSFWQAGFESACHINRNHLRLDMIAVTQHDRQAVGDYGRLRELGFRTARDGVRWHLIERDGRFDFSYLTALVKAAEHHGVEVIWNLCHYGWPDGLDIFASPFVDRFARYCGRVARVISDHSGGVPFYVPANEISFFAWAAGHRGDMYPHAPGRAGELKAQLVRAVIAGCEAIWQVDRRARFVTVEPLIHVIPPRGRPDLAEVAAGMRAGQFEAYDMLAGLCRPELGGHPRYLDIMGVNFYHANQWEYPPEARLRWEDHPRDERWVPFHRLLGEVYERYRRPLFVAETSHFGVGRAPWLREMVAEVVLARKAGVPLEGVCLYPILDRPDWENLDHWHNSGLWDLRRNADGVLERVLVEEYAAELCRARDWLARHGCP